MKQVLFALTLVLAALSLGEFHLFQFNLWLTMVLALFGLHVITGLAGMISMGHGALMGMGAYSAALSAMHLASAWAWGPWTTLAFALTVAVLTGAVAGALLALIAGRLSGHLLALTTFALAAAWPQWLKSPWVSAITSGSQGLVWSALPSGEWADRGLTLALLVVLASCMGLERWARTRHWGLALQAMRDHPQATRELGFDLKALKVWAFAISGAITSLAGALGAAWVGFVSPDAHSALLSITLLVGLAVSGVGQVAGLWLGAAFIQFVPNWAADWSQSMPWAIQGACLLLVAYLAPRGWAQAWRHWRHRA